MSRLFLIISLALLSTHISAWNNSFEWYPGSTWFQSIPSLVVTIVEEELSYKHKKKSLSYPNPIFLSAGNQQPTLFYWLDNDQDITIYIYNSTGIHLGTKHISRGLEGAKGMNMNEVVLGLLEFNLYNITPGVYYYVIYGRNQDKYLYMGKIGVQP